MTRLAPLFLLALAPALRASWPAAPEPVQSLVGQALRSNLALAGESIELERASARLDEARGAMLPRLDAYARYSEATGGRAIDVPVGDLLNGAYATLNQFLASQGQAPRFGTIQNQSIPFLRSHEQQT
jgi:outer membrane protein